MPMAKTFRNLWPALVCWENLVAAYHKCRRRKRHKPEAVRFDFAWESNLLRIQQELQNGSYLPGEYRHFYVYEPKRRKISAAPFRDRVVHHAIVNVLEPTRWTISSRKNCRCPVICAMQTTWSCLPAQNNNCGSSANC